MIRARSSGLASGCDLAYRSFASTCTTSVLSPPDAAATARRNASAAGGSLLSASDGHTIPSMFFGGFTGAGIGTT